MPSQAEAEDCAEQRKRDQRRPNEIELLLERERPEMQHWGRRRALCEVVGRTVCEVDVRCKNGRPETVGQRLLGTDEVQYVVSGDVRDDQRQRGSRQYAAGTANVEAGDGH